MIYLRKIKPDNFKKKLDKINQNIYFTLGNYFSFGPITWQFIYI